MNFDLLFAKAKKAGIEDIQISYKENNSMEVQTLNGDLDKYSISNTKLLNVKGIYNGKMGLVRVELINENQFDFIVEKIIENANGIDSKDEVFIYSGDKEYQKVDLYNQELAKVEAKEKIEKALDLDKEIRSYEHIVLAESFYEEGFVKSMLLNSKGLKLEAEANYAFLGGQAIAKSDKDQRTSFDYIVSNDFNELTVKELAKEISLYAARSLGAAPVLSGTYEVIIKNTAMASLLSPFITGFSADSVQKGTSLLKGKIGEKIASDLITIVDDPFKKNSVRSTSFDDEGVATKYKELVKNGELKGFIYDLRTARIDGVESTGNGFGNTPSMTNLYIVPGVRPYEEMVKDIKDGIVITDLAGTHAGANAITGDFSLQLCGFRVVDGKETDPIALSTVGGNIFNLLKDVTEVGSDLKSGIDSVSSPSLKIKELVISGK